MLNYKNLILKYNSLSRLLVCVFIIYSHSAVSVTAIDSPASDIYRYKMSDIEKEKLKRRMIDKIKTMKLEELEGSTSLKEAVLTPEEITLPVLAEDMTPSPEKTADKDSVSTTVIEEINSNKKAKSSVALSPKTQKTQKTQINAPTRFIDEPFNINVDRNSFVAFGFGGHKIRGGDAIGMYVSGITPISDSNWGVYGRGEIIKDLYKTGAFWSFKMAVGAGYYFSNDLVVTGNVGKCFSNYSTCYFNLRQLNVNDDDINAIYYGIGTFIKAPYLNGLIELSIDWSPYKNYNGRSLYIGYAFRFK